MENLSEYRTSAAETARALDLLHLLPQDGNRVLDVGARDGHFSRLLSQRFANVVALDLTPPAFDAAGVTRVQGDVTCLPFGEATFDCVFCAEVLEHVPDVERACREILRVARQTVIVGVPYRQDIRVGRTTCGSCGRKNPPWGHVNRFTEQRLAELFEGATLTRKSFVGSSREHTNWVSTRLMDLAGNPWGTYSQDEPCVYCGAKLMIPPLTRPLWSRICSALALRISRVQGLFTRPHGNWIHLALEVRR